MPDVRRAIGVGDRGRDVIAGLGRHLGNALEPLGNYRRAVSASEPKTAKIIGLRSRLKTSTSRAVRLSFSHTSANCARRTVSGPSRTIRADNQSRTVSTKVEN